MYAKLVRHTLDHGQMLANGGDSVVAAREHLMVEGARLWHRKYKGASVADILSKPAFEDIRGHVILDYDRFLDEPGRPDFELIRLVVYDQAGMEKAEIVAPNYQLYIMNEAGKTIDSACCLIEQPKVAAPE